MIGIGLNQEQVDQYRTTPGCAAVNRLATQLVALISLEQDNTSDERLSLRLNRSRQQALLNAGVTSFYPLSSLSIYLVCLDQQSVDGVLEAKVLPKWTGFGKLNTSYTFSVHIPDSTGIKNIIIDIMHDSQFQKAKNTLETLGL